MSKTKKKLTKRLATKKVTASALQPLEKTLVAIPVAEVAPPPIPSDKLVAEALALFTIGQQHAAALKRVGVAAALLAGLTSAAHALAEAQSNVTAAHRLRVTKEEERAVEDATDLRSQMVADARFALRHDAEAQASVDRIQEGEGLDDLVQDLRALATLHGQHKGPLAKIGAAPDKKSKRAIDLAKKVESLVATRRAADAGEGRAIDLRNRAATHLVGLMTEVRAAGAYVFRKEPNVLVKFRSAYNVVRRARGRRKGASPTVNGQAATKPVS